MEKLTERYRITVGEEGLEIRSAKGKRISLTALEALMLLDILRSEEKKLKRLAEQASPLPIRMRLNTQ